MRHGLTHMDCKWLNKTLQSHLLLVSSRGGHGAAELTDTGLVDAAGRAWDNTFSFTGELHFLKNEGRGWGGAARTGNLPLASTSKSLRRFTGDSVSTLVQARKDSDFPHSTEISHLLDREAFWAVSIFNNI